MCFDELAEFYDNPLDVDSTSYSETRHERPVYNCLRRERLALLTSDLPESLYSYL